MRRGSALLTALVTIAALSIMVMAFVYEAKQQAGINVYVRERNRVGRLVDAGRILGEIVMVNFKSAPEWSEDLDIEKLLEEDRWGREKQELKSNSRCTIGPILLDEEEGHLLRRRADLVVSLRVKDTLVRENRRFGISEPPAIILKS